MAPPSPAHRISAPTLGRLFKAFRESTGKSREHVMKRFRDVTARHKSNRAYQDAVRLMGSTASTQKSHFSAIEDGGLTDLVQLGAAYAIADAYDVPFLMVDPLLSKPIDSEWLVQSWKRGIEVVKVRMPGDHDGNGCVYQVPNERLLSSGETAFLTLTLQPPAGHSNTHSHPGDELMVVMKGRIQVKLNDYGPPIQLKEGEFVHFYAEQPHSAHAVGGPATVFVIRFYQLDDGGMRGKIATNLEKLDSGINAVARHCKDLKTWQEELDLLGLQEVLGGATNLDSGSRTSLVNLWKKMRVVLGQLFSDADETEEMREELLSWLRQHTVSPGGTHASMEQVCDRFGLARFVIQVRAMLGGTFTPLGLINSERVRLSRIIRGQPAGISTKAALIELARDLQLAPILFAGFLVPAIPNLVVGRIEDRLKIGSAAFGNKPGVEYEIPSRNLAGSDIAVTFLTLDQEAVCQKNRHPGFELLLPIKGACQVWFEDREHPLICNEGHFAHYRSTTTHWVEQVGAKPAKLFVIRFHQEPGPSAYKFLKNKKTARRLFEQSTGRVGVSS